MGENSFVIATKQGRFRLPPLFSPAHFLLDRHIDTSTEVIKSRKVTTLRLHPIAWKEVTVSSVENSAAKRPLGRLGNRHAARPRHSNRPWRRRQPIAGYNHRGKGLDYCSAVGLALSNGSTLQAHDAIDILAVGVVAKPVLQPAQSRRLPVQIFREPLQALTFVTHKSDLTVWKTSIAQCRFQWARLLLDFAV